MKEITILSGKGGTGKTSITAALAAVAQKAVLCDNDVDAADLHLLLQPKIKEKHVFDGGAYLAKIDRKICIACGLCQDYCRFGAIHAEQEGYLQINPYQCEGCRLCERICPMQAITSARSTKNHWFISNTRFGILVHARMAPGEENSGKMVTEVRQQAKKIAEENQAEYIINDGPPGIGCTTIAALAGTQLVLIVIEPSQSGIHDAMRLIELTRSRNIPIFTIINKSDINPDVSHNLKIRLKKEAIPLLAEIPFDTALVEAMIKGQTIVEYQPESEITQTIKSLWQKLAQT